MKQKKDQSTSKGASQSLHVGKANEWGVYQIEVKSKGKSKGKINLSSQLAFTTHRSGWSFAIGALAPLHNDNGILFDGFIENNFLWAYAENPTPSEKLEEWKTKGEFEQKANILDKGIIPYRQPWTGFIHNPHGIPDWLFWNHGTCENVIGKKLFKESLETCVGLFALSEHHAKFLREQTGMVVSVLYHPTEIPEAIFNFDRFMASEFKKVVQVGFWLRRMTAIYELPLSAKDMFHKIRLVPDNKNFYDIEKIKILEQKRFNINIHPDYIKNTYTAVFLTNDEYDALLSESIVMVELYTTSANNVVIECIARATPLLINALPAVVEYLGEEYPFYFQSMEEAAEKAKDLELVRKTHQYLLDWHVRAKMTPEYFVKDFQRSEVYQRIKL